MTHARQVLAGACGEHCVKLVGEQLVPGHRGDSAAAGTLAADRIARLREGDKAAWVVRTGKIALQQWRLPPRRPVRRGSDGILAVRSPRAVGEFGGRNSRQVGPRRGSGH
jgi:hypothetical protein